MDKKSSMKIIFMLLLFICSTKLSKMMDMETDLRREAGAGNVKAHFALSSYLKNTPFLKWLYKVAVPPGVSKEDPYDDQEHLKWLQKSAEGGYAEAQFNLGMAYYNGEGFPQNRTQGVEWWMKAAAQRYGPAELLLLQYLTGITVKENEGKELTEPEHLVKEHYKGTFGKQ
ncbi:MAG: sel1 repeat family protein [Synergistaceae bacterium]|nr:sel1 repeat family protein [Synergistaceae bacterium]